MDRSVSVTIGIPFLNARATLADAVRSVRAQTCSAWQLLLMDDGSTDGSLELARKIEDARVKVISDGVQRGLPYRLNQITALAQTPYLARMDADDLMHPERLARQLRFLDENPRVDVVDAAAFTIDLQNQPLGLRGDQPLDCKPGAILKKGLLIHPTVTGRTEWFRTHRYDSVFVRAEDQELWTRTCRRTTFARLQEPLFFYREPPCGNLKSYLRSAQTVRKIIRIYGPDILGYSGTIALILQSYAKSGMYRAFTKLGIQGRLIGRRVRGLNAGEAQTARDTIARILRTELPGIDRRDP